MRRDIPARAFALCVGAMIAAIAGQTWWSNQDDRRATLETAQTQASLSIRILEDRTSTAMADVVHVVHAVNQSLRASAGARQLAAVEKVLREEQQDSGYLHALHLIDTTGRRWASSDQLSTEQMDVHAQQEVQFLLAHPKYEQCLIGKPVRLAGSGLWVAPVFCNLLDQEGRQTGMAEVDVNLSYFQKFFEKFTVGNHASVSLHDADGRILVAAPMAVPAFDLETQKSRVVQFIRGHEIESSIADGLLSDDARRTLYHYRKIRDFPLAIVYQRDVASVLSEWKERSRQKLALAAVTIFFILFLASLLLWQIRYLRLSQKRLEANEKRYRLLFQEAHDAIVVINRGYVYVDCNAAATRLYGVSSEQEVIGRRAGTFSPQEQNVDGLAAHDKDTLVTTLVDLAFLGEPQRFEWVTHRHGQIHYNEISLSRVEVEGEMLLYCVMRDINARKYTEHLLEGQNRLLQMIGGEEQLPVILEALCQFVEKLCPHWICGVQLLADDHCSFAQVFGKRFPVLLKEQLPGMVLAHGNGVWCDAVLHAMPTLVDDIHQAPSMRFVNALETLTAYSASGAWPILGKNGQVLGSFTLFYTADNPLSDEDLSLIGITTDIAGIAIEGRRSEQKILQLAHYDELTGLPNRFLYNQYLGKALALAERNRGALAVLFLDLDRFKNINDTFGHNEGDNVLRKVSTRFRHCLRDSDTIARIGGDEFILLIENFKDPLDLSEVADKLLFEATQPFEIDGQECQLSASIGIATYPDDGDDARTLLKNADIAMYRAKNKGKNNYQFYAAEMNIHTVERLAFEARLRKALERREFIIHYQPKVDINSGRVVGAEALVRWNHPEHGILYPGDFITLAEEAGLISKLGMLVLDIACRDILTFRAVDKQFGRVAINLSGAQFNDVHLLEEVNSVVEFWRVPPQSIEFEITESMVMHNREQAIILMDGLKDAGFTLSIDDFGTGYSSLAYLKRFPVDSVKVDRSFIKDIPDDPNDTAIVLAIVAMAHTLGLKVIAEGVESAVQLDTLRESRCDEYQGYYFSKPVPDKEFVQLLRMQSPTLH